MFERFGEFEMRAERESLFSIGDLEMLATEPDEAVKAAIQTKQTDVSRGGAQPRPLTQTHMARSSKAQHVLRSEEPFCQRCSSGQSALMRTARIFG
jgi:hypothetical protein